MCAGAQSTKVHQESPELRRIPKRRSSQNPFSTTFVNKAAHGFTEMVEGYEHTQSYDREKRRV
jgi:hypothetical protein